MKPGNGFFVIAMKFAAKSFFLTSIVLLFLLSSTLVVSISATRYQQIAFSTISEAEILMVQSYQAVLNTEMADVNVSGLLVRLNDAAALLAEAHMSFDVGNFEEATSLAESMRILVYDTVDKAELLKIEADSVQAHKFWWVIGTSIVGILAVIVASLMSYSLFKRIYYKRLFTMKPKVE